MSARVIREARFVYRPLSNAAQKDIGMFTAATITGRIRHGVNAMGLPAAPLKGGRNGKPGYPQLKIRKGAKPIRDWTLTGHTLSTVGVLAAGSNQIQVGSNDPKSALIVFFLNRKEKMFGVAPADRIAIDGNVQQAAIREGIVGVERR